MPRLMGGLILKCPLCMWALICPSATLSHTPFLLKGSETPVSNFSRVLSFLRISLQTPLKSSPTLPKLVLENLQGAVIRQRALCHSHWLVPLPVKLQGPAGRWDNSVCPQHSELDWTGAVERLRHPGSTCLQPAPLQTALRKRGHPPAGRRGCPDHTLLWWQERWSLDLCGCGAWRFPTPPGDVFRAAILRGVSHVEGGWGRPGQVRF